MGKAGASAESAGAAGDTGLQAWIAWARAALPIGEAVLPYFPRAVPGGLTLSGLFRRRRTRA